MELSAKRIVTNLYYYTVALLVLAFSVLFMVSMSNLALSTAQAVVYYIWAGLVIVALLLEVFATMTHRYKLLVGLIIYGLMLLAVLFGFIVFAGFNVGGAIPAASMGIFNTLILYSIGLTVGLIIVYSLGLKLMRLDNDLVE